MVLLAVQVNDVQLVAVDPGSLEGSDVYVCIRAEDVILNKGSRGQESARNHLSGTILSIAPEGAVVRIGIDCGIALTALVTRLSVSAGVNGSQFFR
jgi:molybdate transport system ATP-binding protein